MPRPARDWSPLLLAVPLALAVAGYARALRGEFVFDDVTSVVQNPALRDLGAVAAGAWSAFWHGGRPLADLTFALDRRAAGLEPWGHHATSLGLHLATVVLVYLLGRSVLARAGAGRWRWQALAAAGLWAVHPLGSQAVSYVSQRAEVLASLGMVAALLLFLRADRAAPGWREGVAFALGLAAFGLALGAKAMAVTVPALWALLAWAAPGPAARAAAAAWRPRLIALAAPGALALAHGVATLRSLTPVWNAGFQLEGLGPWTYLLSQLRSVATYLRLVLWPAGQSVDWDATPAAGLAQPDVLAAGALLAAVAAAAAWLVVVGRRADGEDRAAARVAGLGLLWFLVVLAPTSSVVPVVDLVVEHRAYLASWGVLLALVAGGERAAARAEARWARAGVAAAALVAAGWLGLAAALHARNAVWESALALWSDAAAAGRGTSRAHVNLGAARLARGDADGALAALAIALERAAGRPQQEAQALHFTGVALVASGRRGEAEQALRRAVERAPEAAASAYALAVLLAQRGDLAGAEDHARRALAAQPDRADATHLLGRLRLEAGSAEEAAALLQRAARIAPRVAAIQVDLGTAFFRVGRVAEACATWQAALGAPADETTRRRLREALAQSACPVRPDPAGVRP